MHSLPMVLVILTGETLTSGTKCQRATRLPTMAASNARSAVQTKNCTSVCVIHRADGWPIRRSGGHDHLQRAPTSASCNQLVYANRPELHSSQVRLRKVERFIPVARFHE